MFWRCKCSTPGDKTMEFITEGEEWPDPTKGVVIVAETEYLPLGAGVYAVKLEKPMRFKVSPGTEYYVFEWVNDLISLEEFQTLYDNWQRERESL